jgi:hypothetical protein
VNSHWSEIGRERKLKKKSGLKMKLKVSTLDIQIKQSGLKVSNSKVFSSGRLATLSMNQRRTEKID